MALIPLNGLDLPNIGQAAELDEPRPQTSRTWRVDWRANTIRGAMVEGREAIEQAIYMILQTQRFGFRIYSWDYGFEMDQLLGRSEAILHSECQRLVTEALTADDRIKAGEDFKIHQTARRSAEIEFTAVTSGGDIFVKTEVTV